MEEEHKKKISKSMIGNKNGLKNKANLGKTFTEEHLKKLRNKTPWNKNMKMWTEEQKKEMSGVNSNASIYLKNKTYEEIYGSKEKAEEIIEKKKKNYNMMNSATINLKGRTYEDIYGPEKAKEQKEKRRMKTKEKYDNGTATFGFPKDGTMKIKRSKQIFPIKDTWIEEKVQKWLMLLGINFYTHQYMDELENAYQCDISIPLQGQIPQKTILECDGDWWHGNPAKYPHPNKMQIDRRERDKKRTAELKSKGFRVIRLWESEIKQMQLEQFAKICYGYERIEDGNTN